MSNDTGGSVRIIRGNALDLPLADNSVDLVVTSPPYFGLRSYQDGGEHYDGQIGAEATPAEFVDALIAATREMMRVVKPSGSIWVNLGDKYAGQSSRGVPCKSLIGIPWRYTIRCIDELGLILRAEVVWSKPNGLPESVKDRVRRSHEQWFHFTLSPRYYSAVDEIREPQSSAEHHARYPQQRYAESRRQPAHMTGAINGGLNPLGKLPGSVWTIPTEPLRVPKELGIDHFAAFPTEWPRRIITGWSPRGVCVECGAGRRPVVERSEPHGTGSTTLGYQRDVTITGETCDCPEPTAPTTPGVVLDPFGGTGTTALVASVLGRVGISVDRSEDYCRLARWRTTDPGERARAARVPKPPEEVNGQISLFDALEAT